MIYVADVKQIEGGEEIHLDLFLYDSDTGLTAKSAIEVPGAYDSIVKKYKSSLCLAKLDSVSITGDDSQYDTSMYGLILFMDENSIEPEIIDVTYELVQLARVPETVIGKLLSQYDDETAGILSKCLDMLRYFEGINGDIKTVLPEESFQFLSDEDKKAMHSTRKTYMLSYDDNVDLFQKDYNSEYLIQLPSLQEIHDGDYNMTEVDVLRVIAPLRQSESGGQMYSYRGIYHTPYYKVDPRLRGSIPKSLNWLEGYCKNDELELQPYERKMFDNIYTLICSDIAYSVDKIITGIFNSTRLGTALRRFASAKDIDGFKEAMNDIISANAECSEARCNITLEDIDNVQQGKFSVDDVINEKLELSDTYLSDMLVSWNNNMNVINCNKLGFVLKLDEDAKADLTEKLIERGVLTNTMFDFLRKLCSFAYTVNWGHSGVTKAINCLINSEKINEVSELLASWVTAMITNNQNLITPQVATILNLNGANDTIDYLDSDDSDDSFSDFDRYLSRSTVARIQASEVSVDLFNDSEVMDSETAIVERIRKENGDNNLYLYLAEVFNSTKNPKSIIMCFIRLMRWGENKPKTLVLPEYPEVKNVFELDSGNICLNTDILDDSMIVKKNGCTYSYVRPIFAQSNCISVQNPIIGFQLEIDYGSVRTVDIMSWTDLGRMSTENNIDIAEFKAITTASLNLDEAIAIEDIVKEKFNFYVSDEMVKTALDKKMKASDLSDLALLTIPNVVESQAYLRAMRNQEVLTSNDLMYKNLREYLKALGNFYETCSNKIASVENTMQIAELAKSFLDIYNSVKSGSTISKSQAQTMSLDSEDNFVNCDLDGKFILIYDDTMTAPFKPIKFSEELMQKVSDKLRNRIVLLLMVTKDKYVFCRKDVKVSELVIENKSISTKLYNKLVPAINALSAGKKVKISETKAFLHADLKEFLV